MVELKTSFDDRSSGELKPKTLPPLLLEYRDKSLWASMRQGEKQGGNDQYFGAMALAYACATKRLDSAEYLMEKMKIPPTGTHLLVDHVLYAAIDYHLNPADQVEIAKLLQRYGVNFRARDLDKHALEITPALEKFMFPNDWRHDGVEMPSVADGITYLTEGNIFDEMSSEDIRVHMNVLALSYAMLKERPVDAEFLMRIRRAPVRGSEHLIDEPLRAAIAGGSSQMKAIIDSYTVTSANITESDPRPR